LIFGGGIRASMWDVFLNDLQTLQERTNLLR